MHFPVTIAALVLGAAVQGWVLLRLQPLRLVGDEVEYISGNPPRSGARAAWIRMPLFGLAARGVARLWPRNKNAPRLMTGLISILALAITTGFVEHAAGSTAATIPAAMMLLSAERAILALHLWPDTAMGLVLLIFALLMTIPAQPDLIGLTACAILAFLIRVEGAVLMVLAMLIAIGAGGPAAWAVWATCLSLLAGLSLWNGLRHGVWAPDSTFAFNLAVAQGEHRQPDAPLGALMLQTLGRESPARTHGHDPAPAGVIAGLLKRVRSLLGPETFVTEVLIAPSRGLYRAMPQPARSGALR